jgi:hypothetical protein
MRKKWLSLFTVVLIVVSVLLAGGCNGKINMVSGCWQLISTGDENGNNQQDSSQSGLPFTYYYDVYPDGHISILFAGEEMAYGRYTMDRDTFTFVSDDGTEKHSGQFTIDLNATDESTGESAGQSMIKLTIILGDQPVSAVLKKIMTYSDMVSYLKSQTTPPAAVATTAVATASPGAEATPAPTASAQ